MKTLLAMFALLMACSSGPSECTYEIKLLDAGTTAGIAGCSHPAVYDCAAELADGGMNALWKANCER